MANLIKLKKFHFIYKTTNILNNKFYIGMHSTTNLKDGYVGSGTHLRHAIRKYGVANFKFEIIEWCDNREKLIQREKEIITEEYINDVNCYNIKPGGLGGFNNKEHQFKCSQAAGIKHRERMINDSEYREKCSKKTSESNYRRIQKGEIFKVPDWTGKKHREETKIKIGAANSIKQKGEANSQFGTRWITNGIDNKKIKKTDLIPNGWQIGRKIKKDLVE